MYTTYHYPLLTGETINFCNRSGLLPENHEWLFAIGGHVHPLPARVLRTTYFRYDIILTTRLYCCSITTCYLLPTY